MFGGSSCCSYGNERLVIEGGRGMNVCKARMGFGSILCRCLPLVLKAMTKMIKIANQIILKIFKSICSYYQTRLARSLQTNSLRDNQQDTRLASDSACDTRLDLHSCFGKVWVQSKRLRLHESSRFDES